MSSAFCKILAPITVPTGGWDLVVVDAGGTETATVPAGDYLSMYHLGAELEDQLQAIGGHGSDAVAISSVGQCTITSTATTSYTWASTSSDLYEALGFAGSETVSANVVTATNKVTHAWFPGTITHGTSGGAGVISDTGWIAENSSRAQISGSRKTREIGPSDPPYMRDIRIGLINSTEHRDRDRGPKILLDRYRYNRLLWVPDRDDVTVASTGTQGDPGSTSYNDDDTTSVDYWLVRLMRDPDIRRDQMRPDYAQIGLRFNAEPA